MGVLSKYKIKELLDERKLQFTPELDQFQMQPHAVDLRLGWNFKIPRTWKLSEKGREALNVDYLLPQDDEYFDIVTLSPGQYFELLPSEFVIVSTLESIQLIADDVMAVLYPRTTINRRGLSVNLSGIIDVGYQGGLILPITNNTDRQTIKLYPGERICQVVFYELTDPIQAEDQYKHGMYAPKYQDSHELNNFSKADNVEETEMIMLGDIEALKKRFRL